MTQDEIIEMARKAGMAYEEGPDVYVANIDDLQDFAKLVAAKERERICKQIAVLHDSLSLASAAVIRARGEQVATNDTSKERVDEIQKQRHEQEPFRFTNKENWLSGNGRMWSEMHREEGDFPVYITPPQRTWRGLTDIEWSDLYEAHHDKYNQLKQGSPDGMDYERAIEAKLKEKNT